MTIALVLATPEATECLGAGIAKEVTGPCVIYLRGDLGAGKTTFARGFVRALGHGGKVKSPTYTLVEDYATAGGQRVFHCDLYRIADPEELEYIGIRDLADGRSVLLVEWPERGQGVLPPADLDIRLRFADGARDCRATALSAVGERLLARIQDGMAAVEGDGNNATKP